MAWLTRSCEYIAIGKATAAQSRLFSKTSVGDTYTILLHPRGLLQSLLALVFQWLEIGHVTMQKTEDHSTKVH